jgi:hypothetical protein
MSEACVFEEGSKSQSTDTLFRQQSWLLRAEEVPQRDSNFIASQVRKAQEACVHGGGTLLSQNNLYYEVRSFEGRVLEIIHPILDIDQTLGREIHLISEQVVYHQGEQSASPKIYHSSEHTLQVLSGIVGFLLRNEAVLTLLEPAGVRKLLFTCLTHDINHNYSFHHPHAATVKKHSLNETLSEMVLGELGISFAEGEPLNYVTKVDPGNFDMGQLLVTKNLMQLLGSEKASKKDKIISFLLQYYDTFPKDPQAFFQNGLKIWMEEFALVALFNALNRNEAANGTIASWELYPRVSQWSQFKLDLIAHMRGVSSLQDFNRALHAVFKQHNISESDQQMMCSNLYGGLKFFLGVQSIIAANFKQNAEDALGVLKTQSIVDDQFIEDLNLSVFDQVATSASVVNLVTVGVSDYNSWQRLVTHLTRLCPVNELVEELFGEGFDMYEDPTINARTLELTQAKEPAAQQPMRHLYGRALFELVTGACQRSATLTSEQIKECILSKTWQRVDTRDNLLEILRHELKRLSQNLSV